MTHPDVVITSFGYLHGGAPEADIVIDVRRQLRNPYVDPMIRDLTGFDGPVQEHVLATPGAYGLVRNMAQLVSALWRHGVAAPPVTVAIGCAGGRHRSVVLAQELRAALSHSKCLVADIVHRDVERPVVNRARERQAHDVGPINP